MSYRILIIDDEEHIRRMVRLTLEAAGYKVGEAKDGLEGLSVYEDGKAWDAVILDQRMPGMDGLETLQEIKERDPGARVIMISSLSYQEKVEEALAAGAKCFVAKPVTTEQLRQAIDRVFAAAV